MALLALALTEPLEVERGVGGVFHLYRPYLLGVATGGVALIAGASLQGSSAALALAVSLVLGSALFIGAVRLLRFGLTRDDRDALVAAVGVRAQRYLFLLLRPITTTDD